MSRIKRRYILTGAKVEGLQKKKKKKEQKRRVHFVECALYREGEAEAGRSFLPSLVLNRLTSTSFTLSMTSPASTCKTNRFYENAFC